MPILNSGDFGLVANGTTDNSAAINNWIAAATTLIAAGNNVRMALNPGVYASSGFHTFPGAADLEFQNASLWHIGTLDTDVFITHGVIGASGSGNLYNINLLGALSGPTILGNMNYVGLRLLNKNYSYCSINQINQFHTGLRIEANQGSCAYNTIDVFGDFLVCREAIEIVTASANDTSFAAQNIVRGGNIQPTSSFNNLGSAFGLVFTRYYANGYTGNSGNFWYGACFQMGDTTLPPNWTSSQNYAVNTRILGVRSGLEWMVQTAGTSGTTEPTKLPTNLVPISGITIMGGSTICTMTSTSGLSAGMHMRGDNPLNAFPVNTYISAVNSSTQITLTQPAYSGITTITTFTATFSALTSDGTSQLVCLGPYRRAPVWLRDAGTDNGVRDARWEGNIGAAVVISGRYLFPQNSSYAPGRFQGSFHSLTSAAVNVAMYPKWTASTAYAFGDMVTRAALNGVYWECIVGGTSGGSEPNPPDTALTTITDNSVTWIARNLPKSSSRGDYEEFTGSVALTPVEIQSPTQTSTSVSTIDALHMRAIGSATGWRIRGVVRGDPATGATSLEFASTDFALSREGILLNSTTSLLGINIRTDKVKSLRVRKHFGVYSSSYTYVIPLDYSLGRLTATSNQTAYHRRVIGNLYVNGSGSYNEPSSGPWNQLSFGVNDEVANTFVGIVQGGAPCVLGGLTIAENPHRATPYNEPAPLLDGSIQLYTNFSTDQAMRTALGTPTSGYFLAVGEYIANGSATSTVGPQGWIVTTGGILAPPWHTTTAYVTGQIVTVSGNAYAANGAFTSGTAPSGTGKNILDGSAGSIAAGNVATWDYLAPMATLTPIGPIQTAATAVTLAAGSATVSLSSVTANSFFEYSVMTPGGTQGAIYTGTITPGTGFVIKSTSSSDTSKIWWRQITA